MKHQSEPADPNFAARIRDSFARQRVMGTFGAELELVEPGRVHIRMPFREDLCQQHGFLHAGVVATIADSACGYAAATLMPADSGVLAVEFKSNFTAPAQGADFVAKAEVLRPGRTLHVCRADVFACGLPDRPERLCATMLGTMLVVEGRDDVKG